MPILTLNKLKTHAKLLHTHRSTEADTNGMWMLSSFFQVLYCFLELLLIADILLNFRVGILDMQTKDTILDRRIIRQTYIYKGTFGSDVLNAFPCDIINFLYFDSRNNFLTMLTMIKIIRIPLFFRILKKIWMPTAIREYFQRLPSIVRLFKILFLFFMILHVMSCFYWRCYLYIDAEYFDAASLDEDEFSLICDKDLKYIGGYNSVFNPQNKTYTYCTKDTQTMWRPYDETVVTYQQTGKFIDAYFTSLYWSLLVVIGNR